MTSNEPNKRISKRIKAKINNEVDDPVLNSAQEDEEIDVLNIEDQSNIVKNKKYLLD